MDDEQTVRLHKAAKEERPSPSAGTRDDTLPPSRLQETPKDERTIVPRMRNSDEGRYTERTTNR